MGDHGHQGHCPARAQVLCLDWWLHLVRPRHLPVHVDHQGRVRRGRPVHRAPQVLLRCLMRFVCLLRCYCCVTFTLQLCFFHFTSLCSIIPLPALASHLPPPMLAGALNPFYLPPTYLPSSKLVSE